MAISEAYTGTKTVGLDTFTVTIASPGVFTNVGHGCLLDDAVNFTTTGALPTGLVVGTVYYVISAGLTADAFQVAATKGGAAINTSGTQSGTHTMIPEHTLNTTTPETTDGIYQVVVDVGAMALADFTEIRVKEKAISGGTQRTAFTAILAHAPSADDSLWVSPSLILLHGWDVTLRQTAGTARAYPYSIRKVA